MSFFKNILSSIYSPVFYSTIPQMPFGSALRYFLSLILLLVFIQSIVFIPSALDIKSQVATWIDLAFTLYPDELVIKIRNGQVTTNVTEPYFIRLPAGKLDGFENLVVIDTATPFSVSQFNQYRTFVWLTRDSIFLKGDKPEIRTFDLSQVKDSTINKATLNFYRDKFSPWLKFIIPIIIVGGVLLFFLSYTFRLLYLLLLSLLILVLAKVLKSGLNLGQAYKVGLYGMTLALLVEAFLFLTNRWLHFTGFPFMFTLITLLVIGVNLFGARRLQPREVNLTGDISLPDQAPQDSSLSSQS